MSKAQDKRDERDAAIEQLRKMVKPGDTVYTILKHVSQSGMSRDIALIVNMTYSDGHSRILNISSLAAKAAGFRMANNDNALKVGGCGMDMGFSVVYSLGRTLYPEGPEAFDRNGRDRNRAPGGTGLDAIDGGYSLHQAWL